MLPPALELLHFSIAFDQPMAKLQLPDSLRTLIIERLLNQPLHELRLPAGLQCLVLRYQYGQDCHAIPPAEDAAALPRLPVLPAGLRVFEAPRWALRTAYASLLLPRACVVHAT